MYRLKHLVYGSALLLLSSCSDPLILADIEQKYSSPASRRVPVMGMNVHYRDEGEGPIVLLLHGTGSSLHTWDAWNAELKERFRLIRLDLPGCGLTGPRPDGAYEVEDDVAFLKNFLSQLGIRQAHWVGSSLGGRIAWEYSLRYSNQVSSLTLINALGYPQAQWPPAIQLARYPIIDTLMARFLPKAVFKTSLRDIYDQSFSIDDALVDRYYELAHLLGNLQAFTDRVKARLDRDSARVSDIKRPTLVIWGESDRYFPVASAYRFHKDIAGSQLVIFPGVGHLPMEEAPIASANAFRDFILTNSL